MFWLAAEACARVCVRCHTKEEFSRLQNFHNLFFCRMHTHTQAHTHTHTHTHEHDARDEHARGENQPRQKQKMPHIN